MNSAAQGIVLLLLGGATLRVSLTDTYLRYVKEGLRPFLIASGAALVVMAVTTLWAEIVRPDRVAAAQPHCAQGGPDATGSDDHGHHRDPMVSWLLLAPVLALLLVAPPALGSEAASRNGTALSAAQTGSDFPPLPDADPARISVLDYASRAVFEKGKSLGDRRLVLSGFIVIGADGKPYLARMILTCCAADARPVKVGMAGAAPGDVTADTWIEVVGRYTDRSVKDDVNGETIPFIDVESSRRIQAPRNQYE